MQVLDCEQLPGGCVGNGNAESVFDTEKEQLVDSLFRLLQATAGTGLHGGFNGSLAEAPALTDFLARQADLDRHQLKANSIACLTSMPCNPRWRSNATDLAAMNQRQRQLPQRRRLRPGLETSAAADRASKQPRLWVA